MLQKTELVIASKAGGMIEISGLVESCEWVTNRTGQPGKFTFTYLKVSA